MMKKIFALVFILVLGKMSYSQTYPLQQNLGSDSTIVISKGALQSRLAPIVISDTTAANNQRIKNYPGAQLYTANGDFYVRNATATKWVLVSSGSSGPINIYNSDGTLTGNRVLTGAGNSLTFNGISGLGINKVADSVFTVEGGIHATGGLRLDNLASSPGTKTLRIDGQGVVSVADTTVSGGTVTSIATNNGTGITGGTITSTGTLAIDTTNVISTKANVTSGLAGKLNISDTAAMLAPYLRAIDTTSLSNRINLKLNISDTASMLGNYLNNVGYGLSKAGQVVSADSATLSNYYLRRKDSLTTTNPLGYVTKQILADTAAAIRSADAGGTVTSVGLTMPAAFNVGNSPITTAGTISVTAAGLVSQYIRGDGTLADFPGGGGGGGASISYYLNGSVNQGTFGGNTYYEMNKTPIFGTGTNFSINADGYIAQFITDAGDPGLLKIPGGNWNFELFFNASSGGGTPTYYVELYKYDGTTFTLIASGSSNPDVITGGTSVEAYFSTLPVPETVLTLTDRLAVRIYVTHAGRTITLHTEDNNLCQVITTFTTGITALNGLTEQVQYFTTGTSGTDFNISSSVATHTFNLPTASATNRGALSTTDWTTFNNKVGGSLISGYIPKATGTNTIDTSQLFQDGQNVGIGTLTPNGRLAIVDTGGFALKINYNSASNVSDSNAAIYAENNGLSSYVAIFNEKTTNNTGAQLPLLIESSLTTGTPQANMGTGLDFGTRDDANNRKLNRFIVRGTDPAAATYTSRAEFRLWNNGVQTTPYYWLGNGNMGLGTSTPDSNLTVVNGAYFQRGIRASGLPAAPGTKALRIDASGTLSYADTLIDAGGTVTSIATNNGTGITGGTITTTGTLAIDTLLISTRAWRQKGVDSVAALVNSNVSGTTNRVSKFTGANTIGNSSIADSSSSVAMTILSNGNIGINTTAPNERLEIVGTSRFTRTTSPSVYLNISMENGFAEYDARGSIDHVWENGGVENMRLALGGNLGIGTASPDSMLTVLQGARFQRGVRMSGLPSAPGTRALRIDANGTLSVADTTTGGGGIGGSGTTNYLPKFTASTTLGDSRFFDNGTVTFLGNGDVNATPSTGIFSGTGGTGTNIAGAELRIRGGASTGNAAGGIISFYTSAAGSSGTGVNAATEIARITTEGRLGIGTTSPSSILQIEQATPIFTLNQTTGNSNQGIYFNNSGTNYGRITSNAITGLMTFQSGLNSGDGYLMRFITDGGERMRITSAGNVGIGTTSPANQLTVAGAGGAAYVRVEATDVTLTAKLQARSGPGTIELGAVSNSPVLFVTNDTERMRILSGGNIGINTTTIGSRLQVNGNAAIGYSASTAAPTNGLAVAGNTVIGNNTTTRNFEVYNNGLTDAIVTSIADNNSAVFSVFNNGGTSGNFLQMRAYGNTTGSTLFGLSTNKLVGLFSNGDAGFGIGTVGATALVFGTTNTERARILSGGGLIIGNGETAASPSTGIISGTGGTGTNIAGAEFRIRGGASTGSGAGGPITFYTSAAGSAGTGVNAATERMRITSAGNVAIGTTSTTWLLSLEKNSAGAAAGDYPVISINNPNATGYAGLNLNDGANTVGLETRRSTGHLALFTANSERMRITSGGSIGIGTTTIGSTLQVNGNAAIGYSASTAAPTNGLAVAGGITSGAYIAALGARISSAPSAQGVYLGNSGTTSTDYATIEIVGGSAGGGEIDFTSPSVDIKGRIGYNNSSDFMQFLTNGTEKLRISSGGQVTLSTGANVSAIAQTGYSLTGSNASSLLDLAGTWNTTGNPAAIKLNITNTASGASAYLMDLQVGSATQFRVTKAGAIRTAAPTSGTANDWKLGSVVGGTTVLDTTQWLEVEVGGTLYRVALVTLPEPEPGATPASTPEDRKISEPVKTSSQRIQELENEIQELRKIINFLMPTSKNKK